MITQLDLLTLFDDLAAQQSDLLTAQLTDAGIPSSLQGPVQNDLAIALAGMRLTMGRWSPKPALQDTTEQRKLQQMVEALIAREVRDVTAPYLDRFSIAVARTRQDLMIWNSGRHINQERLTAAEAAALSDTPVVDDSAEYEELPSGGFLLRLDVRPDPQDAQDEQRRRRNRERRQQQQG